MIGKPATLDVRSVLVIQAHGLGDLIMATPVLRALRERWPQARVTVAVGSRSACELLGSLEFVDDVSIVPPRWSLRFLRWCIEMRRRRFEMAIVATRQNALWPALLRTLVGVSLVGAGGEGRASRFAARFRRILPAEPYVISNCALVELMTGLPFVRREPEIRLNAIDRSAAAQQLLTHGIPENSVLLGVHSGSEPKVWQKRYPGKQLREAIGIMLEAVPKLHVLAFFGGEPDDDRQDYRGLHPRLHIIEDAPIRVVAALLELCDATLSGDTGLSHLAAALGTRTVVIAGPTLIEATRPWGDQNVVVSTSDPGVPCIPCFGTDLYGTCTHVSCMTTLPARRVAQAVLTSLVNDGLLDGDD